MTLVEARNLLDILVDKVNNPYFTNAEKDEFLELALTDFIEKYYTVYDINEQSRAALKGLVTSDLSASGSGTISLPDDHIYTLSLSVNYRRRNSMTGTPRERGFKKTKQVAIADFKENNDPFNGPNYDIPVYTYVSVNGVPQIHILPNDSIDSKQWYFIQRPDLTTVFNGDAVEGTYQHEIVQIAARKMLANIESPNYEIQSQEAN